MRVGRGSPLLDAHAPTPPERHRDAPTLLLVVCIAAGKVAMHGQGEFGESLRLLAAAGATLDLGGGTQAATPLYYAV